MRCPSSLHKKISARPWFFAAVFLMPTLWSIEQAQAANGDVIITVQNELGAALAGATFNFRTNDMGAVQSVTDGSVNDGDGANNGTITILAATMAGFGACNGGGAGCGGGGGGGGDAWISKTVTKTGYVTDVTITTGVGGGGTNYRVNASNNGSASMNFTVRVSQVDEQFGNTLTLSSTYSSFSGLTLTDAVSYNGGEAYLPASPAAPGILTLTHAGYLASATTANVAPSAAAQITVQYGTGGGEEGPALQYNLIVTAQDELGNDLTLTSATTSFSGLTLSGTERYSAGHAYLPADPATVAKLTVSLSGYVNTQTTANVTPNSSQVQTIAYKPTSGQGAGLPFTVFVRAWDELNFRRLNLSAVNSAFSGGLSLNGTIRYLDSCAYIPLRAAVRITLSQKGYIDTRTAANVTPSASARDSVDFKTGAGNAAAGLPFSFRIRIKDASNQNLNAAHVDILTGAEARVKDVNNDSTWTSASPTGADSGYVYIPLDETSDDNTTLAIRVQHSGYLTDQNQYLASEVNSTFQIQRLLQMGAQLAAPTLRAPQIDEVVKTLKPVLKWTRGAGADSFTVQLNTKKDFSATGLDTVVTPDSLALTANLVDKTVYYWRVRAKGMGGNTGPFGSVWSFQVNLDNVLPMVALPAPSKDSLLHGKVSMHFTATDNDSVSKREISIDGADYVASTNDSTYLWNTKLYPDGSHTLLMRVTDRGGNVGYSNLISARIDNSAPDLRVVSLQYSNAVSKSKKGGMVLVQVSAKDALAGMSKDSAVVLLAPTLDSAQRINLLHDDGLAGDIVALDGIYSLLLPLTTDSSQVAYSLRARDAFDHDTTVTGKFHLDLTAPSLSISFEPPPQKGADTRHGEVYVEKLVLKGEVADNGGTGLSGLRIEIRNDSGSHVQNSPILLTANSGAFSQIINLVPGNNQIRVIAQDSAGNLDTVTSMLTSINPKVSGLVDQGGGSVYAADGSGVEISADALFKPLQITVREVPPSDEPKPLSSNVKLLGVPREFGPDKTVFRKPVTITLAYTDADLDPNQDGKPDFEASKLTIVFWDGRTWVKAGEPKLDAAHHLVSVEVNHFTLFDLAQSEASTSTEVIAYWSKNPFTPDQGTVFTYQLPAAGKVSLHVLDMAGDLVREIIPRGTSRPQGDWSEVWRGDDVSGHFVGVGLYLYIFKYESDDHNFSKIIRLPIGVGK